MSYTGKRISFSRTPNSLSAKANQYRVIFVTIAATEIESINIKYKNYNHELNVSAGFSLFIKLIKTLSQNFMITGKLSVSRSFPLPRKKISTIQGWVVQKLVSFNTGLNK